MRRVLWGTTLAQVVTKYIAFQLLKCTHKILCTLLYAEHFLNGGKDRKVSRTVSDIW